MAKSERFSVAYGFEFIRNRIHSEAYAVDLIVEQNSIVGNENRRMIPTRYPSNGSKYSIVAGYGNFRYDLSDKTTLAFGTRYTHTL